jgi:hypothetical protein
MTVSQAINNFKLYYNSKTGVESYGFTDSEIKQLMQDSQMELIGDKASGGKVRESIMIDQKNVSELEYFIVESSLTPTASSEFDYECTLPTGDTGLLYYMRSKSKVNRSDYPEGTGLYFKNVFVKHDWIDKFEEYGKKNHFIQPRATISNGKLYLLVDSFTSDLTTLKISYIRKPKDITNLSSGDDVDIPENLNDDVIQLAVRKSLASQAPEQQRYQVQSVEQQKTTD